MAGVPEGPFAALSLAVVGARFPNPDKAKSNRRFEIRLCTPEDPIELRPEPRNRHDPRAIAVFSERGIQIGYLTAERCGLIGALIRSGREYKAVFQTETDFGAWIRIAFNGAEPVLPPGRPMRAAKGASQDSDFFPDEIYPDEVYPDHSY